MWEEAFPDPSTSPAHYARALLVRYPHVITAAGAEAGSLIASFSSAEHLQLGGPGARVYVWADGLTYLHAFSPAVKSLRVNFSNLPFPHFFDLILSFPLLEDLTVIDCSHDEESIDNGGDTSDGLSTVVRPANLPTFAGSLKLLMRNGMGPIVHRLLPLPSGIHFRKLTVGWECDEDTPLTTALVEGCSRTLEYLEISYKLCGGSIRHPRPHG